MHHRPFNGSTRQVSDIGLGCWQIGGSWGEVEESTAMQILADAQDAGINFFDTADVYGGGRSENLIGRFLKDRGLKDEIFVATKLARKGDVTDPQNVSPASIAAYTEGSLARLGVEALDLTQLHCISTDLLRDGAAFDALRNLKKQGKIKAFGASVESMEEAEICMAQEGLASLQIIFNCFRQKPIHTIFDAAKERKIALIIRLPLASGLLAGKMSKQTEFAEDDHRNFNADGEKFNVGETFAGLEFETGVEAADAMKPVLTGAADGATMAQASLRWILDHDAVTTVIAGASRPSQVRDNAAASDLPPLAESTHARLAEIYEEKVKARIRGPH